MLRLHRVSIHRAIRLTTASLAPVVTALEAVMAIPELRCIACFLIMLWGSGPQGKKLEAEKLLTRSIRKLDPVFPSV